MTQDDSEAEDWKDQFNKLQDALESANENGLLKDNSKAYSEMMNIIADALNDLSANPPKTIEARKKFGLAWQELNQHINSTSFSWRFRYCYGGPALLYLIGSFVAILATYIFFEPNLLTSNLLWVPSWAFLWGAMGGILHGFWWLWQHVSRKEIRKVWYIWYLVLPFMGAVLGALTYLIFLAGFIATTGETQIQVQSFVMLLSGLAGFSARWAVQMLDKITKTIKIGA
jgi:hypothetical protein